MLHEEYSIIYCFNKLHRRKKLCWIIRAISIIIYRTDHVSAKINVIRAISIIIYRTDHVSAKINVDVIGKSLINSSSDIPQGSTSILSILIAYEGC